MVVPESVSARAAEQGSDRASSTHPGLLQPIVPCSQGNRGVEADHRSVLPQCLRTLPELHYGDASVNPQGPTTGPVVNLPRPERCLLSYRDPPSGQTLPTLLSQRHRLAIYSTAIRVVNQSESIYQNTQTCTSICPPPSGKVAHVYRRLVAKPRDSPGSSRANILAQVPVPKAVGFKPREVGSNPFSGCLYLGIELDTSVGLARPSHKRLTNWLSVAEGFAAQQSPPAVQWLQVLGHLVSLEKLVPYGRIRIRPIQWQLRLQWSQSKEKSSKLIPLDLQSRLAILWWTNRDNLRRGVPIGTIDVEYYLYTDSSTQGWGAHLQELTASGIWSQDQSQLHINVLELQAIWLGLRAFSQRVENARVALMSDNTSAVAYLRNQGGTKSLTMNDLATDICLWSEKRGMTSSPLSSRASECVGGPSVPEGSNPQDRVEPKPDHSRQDFSCLGQTIRGSVCPREEHEIGNIRLPHSGGDFLESGQSCPELGRPVRVCVPSDKPDKGLSKQGQNRKRRDRPNSTSLAQPGVVSGPTRSLNRLSNNSPTSAETAQADLLTPLSSASVASQPSRLEVIKGFHKERGFSEAVAQRLAISQRQSSAGVYESKWKVFGEWCHVKQINPVKATVQQLADFLIFLFEEKKLAISSIQGYRSCISKVFLARGIDISHDRDLNMLVRNFAIERPVQHREAPRWDLMVVLRLLMKPPFEPMKMASLADMTRKLAFLLTLASAKRNSEVWAFSADVRFGQDYNAATLLFLTNFLAKTMDPSRPDTDYAPVTIPALGPSMGEDLPDRLLCPVRALRYYLKLKHKGLDHNNRFRRLLCAFKLGHIGDISKQTVSGWIRQLIKQAYSAVQDEDIPHLTHTNFQARELRAFASSLAFHQNYSLKQVMEK